MILMHSCVTVLKASSVATVQFSPVLWQKLSNPELLRSNPNPRFGLVLGPITGLLPYIVYSSRLGIFQALRPFSGLVHVY